MIPQMQSKAKKTMPVDRKRMLQILNAGLATGSYRFTRQAALAWMTTYPGDLEINLLYAHALVKEMRFSHAVPVIQKILRADPEYLDAAVLGEEVFAHSDPAFLPIVSGTIKALGGTPIHGEKVPEWGLSLNRIRQLIQRRQNEEARQQLMEIINITEQVELACYYHLLLTKRLGDRDTLITLARLYHSRWPENIQITLLLAGALLEGGETDEAVQLLHYCAANDPSAQVITRLWGDKHSFKPLYPVNMQIDFDLPIPAEVSGKLGLNQLGAGGETVPGVPPTSLMATEVTSFDGYRVLPTKDEFYPEHPKVNQEPASSKKQFIAEVEATLKKVALDISQPSLSRTDERFPAYVILTMKSGLEKQYGKQSARLVIEELKNLAKTVEKNAGWTSIVFLPDDLQSCGKYNITPVDRLDPWKIKLSLVDLDKALVRSGERIGAVLIVGGDEVVPFHRLPNPTDDSDESVPSDSPYGALDTNYFVTDWPVGRLPGEYGADMGLLMEQMRNLMGYHGSPATSTSLIDSILNLLFFWNKGLADRHFNLGYTASVWRRSSLVAFRPIGEGKYLYLSPNGKNASFDVRKLADAQVGYFNVHGVEDAGEWYGQKDPTENDSGPDFPVALRPMDIQRITRTPRIVFCEACYGGHILEKAEDESIALTMLGKGVLAMVGSTTISYGSVTTPLIGADLIGYLVLKNLRDGLSIGASMLKAKAEFVREMNRRQGYLDGEDQKTLISFVLYGDPLVAYDQNREMKKMMPRDLAHPVIKTISDSLSLDQQTEMLAPKMIAQAKTIARDYLPGIENAEVRIKNQQYNQLNNKKYTQPSGKVVVSISKQLKQANRVHQQYARVTMDKHGKIVKIAVSR